ncbi:18616_t:CDS:10 [Acaulospora morrowiae]|uniref:18616_t:CDS:1 n=1 Tax=Acaulospora morrowiae TaxID=94023 RepID=A0A9N9GYF4_9GLOM|nr:18616_t:CDS:10 [Acaulospora morrowiae]
MDQVAASAFVEWVNTFDEISRPVYSVQDLTDGVVLFKIVRAVDPAWFKLTTDTCEGSWPIKFNELKKLHQLLIQYCEEILGLSAKNIEMPNLIAIAKDGDSNETMKLCSLVLTVAVSSSNKAAYIEKINSLSQKSKEKLMLSIESVMNRLGTSQPQRKPLVFVPEDGLKEIAAEHRRLVAEKDALEKAHQALMEEHTRLRHQFDDFQVENEELNLKLKELKLITTQSSQNSEPDPLMRIEIENLRHELSRSENKRHETELLIESQNVMINDLVRKVELLSELADEAALLKGQLDMYRNAADKLKKTENVIEKYKKKLEESADMRKTIKNLEQENQTLVERNRVIEDKYHKIAASKSLTKSRTQQTIDPQLEKMDLINQRNKYEFECKRLQAKVEAYKNEKTRDMDKIRLLEDRLRKLEPDDGKRIQEPRMLADEMKTGVSRGDTITSLKLKINELECELAKKREKEAQQVVQTEEAEWEDQMKSVIIDLDDKADDWEYL